MFLFDDCFAFFRGCFGIGFYHVFVNFGFFNVFRFGLRGHGGSFFGGRLMVDDDNVFFFDNNVFFFDNNGAVGVFFGSGVFFDGNGFFNGYDFRLGNAGGFSDHLADDEQDNDDQNDIKYFFHAKNLQRVETVLNL